MSHTPGPWKVAEDSDVMTADGYAIHTHPDYSSIDNADEIIANARLIAVAPDLLNAVRFLLSNPDNRISAADINAAEAVLAKVKS